MYENGRSGKTSQHRDLEIPKRLLETDDPTVRAMWLARESALLAEEQDREEFLSSLSGEEEAALVRLREEVMKVRGGKKLQMILASPMPAMLIRSMPPQELLYNLRDIGLEDCAELVVLADQEQLRYVLDLDCWRKDQFDAEQFTQWLQYLVAEEIEAAEAVLRAADIESVVLYFQRLFQVYNTSEEEEPPEEPMGERIDSISRAYTVILPFEADDPMLPLARSALRLFEQYGFEFCHRFYESIRWSLPSTLQEEAYQFHKARLEDLGFVDYYEALAILQPLPPQSLPFPASLPPSSEMKLPILLPTEEIGGRLAGILRDIEDEGILQRIRFEWIYLNNKVIAAQQHDAGDPRILDQVMRFVQQMIDLGLEASCGADRLQGVEMVCKHHLEWLFRRGFTELLHLKKRAARLVKEERLTLVDKTKPLTLLPSGLRRFLTDLRQAIPRFFLGIFEGEQAITRPFRTMAEIALAREAVEAMAYLPRLLFEKMGFSYDTLRILGGRLHSPAQIEDITITQILATAWAQLQLSGRFLLEPLQVEQIAPALQALFLWEAAIPRSFRPDALSALREGMLGQEALDEKERRYIELFLAWTLREIHEEGSRLSPTMELDARFFRLFLIRGRASAEE